MQNNRFISIIIPCLNNEDTIENCILSLLYQNYPTDKFEIIIVDNYSIDNTLTIIKKYNVKLLKESIKNPYISRNEGALKSQGKILAFTDANCIAHNNWLKEINISISKEADISQGPGHITRQINRVAKTENQRLEMNDDVFWGDAKNLAIKKDVFFELDGFFNYFTGSDSLLLKKASEKGYIICFNQNQIVYKQFPIKFFKIIKKSWKYGKGDIMLDLYNNNSRLFKKYKQMLKSIHKSLITFINTKNSEAFISAIMELMVLEVRYASYIVNYKKVKKNLEHEYHFHAYAR
jgi:glycosyltransferase involved in cell wall biosynthesis